MFGKYVIISRNVGEIAKKLAKFLTNFDRLPLTKWNIYFFIEIADMFQKL